MLLVRDQEKGGASTGVTPQLEPMAGLEPAT